MTPPADIPSRPAGSVLVLVLVTLLLFSTVVSTVVRQAALAEEEHVRLFQTVQAGFQAEAALHRALALIARSVDHSDAEPGQPGPSEWREDGIRVTIVPTNAKLNLNALHPPTLHPQVMTRLRKAVHRLLLESPNQGDIQNGQNNFQAPTDNDFKDAIRNILLWLGDELDPAQPGSARKDNVSTSGSHAAYRPRMGPMQRPEELLLVPGLAKLHPDWVRRRFTVWGADGRVNLNLADKEVILAVAPELEAYWPAIQRHRTEFGFQRQDELLAHIRLPMNLYQRVLPHLTLDADTLEIAVEIRQPAWYERHRIIVERPSILTDTPPRILARDVLQSRPLGPNE